MTAPGVAHLSTTATVFFCSPGPGVSVGFCTAGGPLSLPFSWAFVAPRSHTAWHARNAAAVHQLSLMTSLPLHFVAIARTRLRLYHTANAVGTSKTSTRAPPG